jgi:iron complex transport system ATP-binding protein
MIEAEWVRVRAGGRELLRGITLRLAPGSFTAVLGPNGAGKTTLLRALAGERMADAGRVTFDGRPVAAWGGLALARRRAVLAQHSDLAFGLAAGDVVGLGRLPHAGTPAARDDLAACRAVRDHFDLATLWPRPLPTLSGGERQRVQIARAAAQLWRRDGDHSGQALFLDEPAAALDLARQREAIAFAHAMARAGAAVLAVLHEPNLAVDADQVVLLRDGAVLHAGPAREALTAEALGACLGVAVEQVERRAGGVGFLVG